MDIDARTASGSEPLRKVTGSRRFISAATQRKGTMRREKSPPAAVEAGAKRSMKAISICVEERRFAGRVKTLSSDLKSSQRLKKEGEEATCR